jgi:hypothetical protein
MHQWCSLQALQAIPLTLLFATHAGAEKITTVQEAADLISQQIK